VPDHECWDLDQNKAKEPKLNTTKGGKYKSEKAFSMTKAQFANLIAKLPMFQKAPSQKRKVSNDNELEPAEPEQDCSNHLASNSDVSEYYHHDYGHPIVRCKPKQTKTSHLTTEVILEIEDQHGEVKPIRCLLDTGTSAMIILCKFVAKGRPKWLQKPPYAMDHYGWSLHD
jgi:hypothetical protein